MAQLSLSMEQAQTLGVEQAYAMQRVRIDVEVARRNVKELLATGPSQGQQRRLISTISWTLTQVVRGRLRLRAPTSLIFLETYRPTQVPEDAAARPI